jgi:hypothetical protein
VNLFELLLFMTLSTGLLAVGYFLSMRWGTTGWLVGAVPAGLVLAWLMFGTIRGMLTEVRHSRSPRPICHQGKCKPRDYVLIDSRPEKAVFRCRCGNLYVSEGSRFSQILPDSSLLPYVVRDSSRNWKADTAKL